MNTAFREKQKAEALARMAMLGLHPNVIREFKDEEVLNLSEGIGALYWLDDEEKKMVEEFHEEHEESLVYHVIKSYTSIGLMYSLLYVSKYEEEWEWDREDLKEGSVLAYVVNRDMPDCSEFGSIGFRKNIGGLIRTW